MTDDIVKRLLAQVACDHSECEDCDLYSEAAEEIELLREELEASKSAIRGWINMFGEVSKGSTKRS
jgi:hypothetical protein